LKFRAIKLSGLTKLLIFNLLKEKLDVLNFMLLKGHPTKLRKNRERRSFGNQGKTLLHAAEMKIKFVSIVFILRFARFTLIL
jgi:hypothetical protein